MFLHYITVYYNSARAIIEIHPFTVSGKFDLVTPLSVAHPIAHPTLYTNTHVGFHTGLTLKSLYPQITPLLLFFYPLPFSLSCPPRLA